MRVELKITRGTALLITDMIWNYWIWVADDYNGPHFETRMDGGFHFTTCCGNRWDLVFQETHWTLEFAGSRAGWRSYMSAFGAERVPGKPQMARIAGKYLARIIGVESSGGDHGRDPWKSGAWVAERCREDEALLAPAQPWEDAPWRTSFAKAA